MKKCVLTAIAIFILIISVTLAGCKDKNGEIVTPQDNTILTVYFVSGDIECTVPDPIDVKGGDRLTDITVPPDAKYVPEYYQLIWYLDEDHTTPYSGEAIYQDTYLYLGVLPRTYTITYVYDESFTFKGEFVDSYVYGEGAPLPTSEFGEGYHKYGKWIYGEGENEYFSTAVSTTTYGDLTLTFAADPIIYNVNYRLPEGASHTNPETYNITMGSIILQPAEMEGKEFDYWKYITTDGFDELRNKKITTIDWELMSKHGRLQLEAVWKQ